LRESEPVSLALLNGPAVDPDVLRLPDRTWVLSGAGDVRDRLELPLVLAWPNPSLADAKELANADPGSGVVNVNGPALKVPPLVAELLEETVPTPTTAPARAGSSPARRSPPAVSSPIAPTRSKAFL
jgi:hypothetical protein